MKLFVVEHQEDRSEQYKSLPVARCANRAKAGTISLAPSQQNARLAVAAVMASGPKSPCGGGGGRALEHVRFGPVGSTGNRSDSGYKIKARFSANCERSNSAWTRSTLGPYVPPHEDPNPNPPARLRAAAPRLPGHLTGRRSSRACRPSPAGGFQLLEKRAIARSGPRSNCACRTRNMMKTIRQSR